MARNVLGTELVPCSLDPVTGFYRNGCCDTGAEDAGVHAVCAVMTAEFLDFSRAAGNDLSTPMPQYGFPGLVAGRPVVPLRGPLGRGVRRGPGAEGGARGDARVRARVGDARGPARPRA